MTPTFDAGWVSRADPAPHRRLKFREVTPAEFSRGGVVAVERRLAHLQGAAEERATLQATPAYRQWVVDQRTRSLKLAYQYSPDFLPYPGAPCA